MNLITGDLFAAYLRCPIKCFMLSRGKKGSSNSYSEWFRHEEEAYFDEFVRNKADVSNVANVVCITSERRFKTAAWRYAVGLPVRASNLETLVHIVERVPSDGRSKDDQLVPSRLTFTNKFDRLEKVRLAFDSFVLSKAWGHDIPAGKIIHGEKYDTTKMRTASLQRDVLEAVSRKRTLSSPEMRLQRLA